MEKYFNNLGKSLKYNPKNTASAVTVLLLVVLSSTLQPIVPPFLIKLFNNLVFKILYITVLLITFRYNYTAAFVMAIMFLVVMQVITNYQAYIEKNKDNLTLHNMASGLATSVVDSVSSVVTDAGKIVTGVADSISEVSSYLTENFDEEETFTNESDDYINQPNVVTSSPNSNIFPHAGTAVSDDKYISNPYPQPMEQTLL
jgi:hypothetical protein